MEPRYFIASGRSLETVRSALVARSTAIKDRNDWAAAHGGIGYYGDDRTWLGIITKMELPASTGWKLHAEDPETGERVYAPDKTNPKGQGLAAAMFRLGTIPGPIELSRQLGHIYGTHPVTGNKLFCSCGLVGDVYVISVPFNAVKQPLDAIPIKRSEYWRMAEDEADRQDVATTDSFRPQPSVITLLMTVASEVKELLAADLDSGFNYTPLRDAYKAYIDFLADHRRVQEMLMAANSLGPVTPA